MFIKKRFFALFAAITVCFAPLSYAATRTGVSQSRTTNDSENTQRRDTQQRTATKRTNSDSENTQRRDTQQRTATKRTNTPDSENAQYRATQSRSTIQRVSASNNNVANRSATTKDNTTRAITRPTTTARTATTQTRNTSTRTATRPTTTARTATKPNISRAGVTVNNRNVVDNAMSREELNQKNEMTEYCREQYALCMDQYCNILDEDMARCSCSANLSNYEKTVNGLEQANAALQDVAQQIQYIGLSADDINTLFSETEAEAALASTSDSTQLKNDLDKIKKMIVDVKPGTSSSVDTKSGGLNLDLSGLLSFSFDDSDFSLDSIFGNQNNTSNIINQRGTTLHKTATQRCQSSVLTYCKDNGVDTAEVINSYDLKITKDCIAYEQNLNSQNKNMASTIRNAHNVLQKARLMVKQNKNTYDLRGCVTALDECMRTDFVCGDSYENCLDPSGKYIVNGEVVLGSTPSLLNKSTGLYSMWKYDGNKSLWAGSGQMSEYIDKHLWDKKPTRTTSGDIAEFLQYKIGYNDGKNNYGLCMGVLNQCQNYTYDSDGYIYGNTVVREYLTRILPTIKTAQDNILNEYSENCVTDVKSCLTTNGFDTNSSSVAVNTCSANIKTCMSISGVSSETSATTWANCIMNPNSQGCTSGALVMETETCMAGEYKVGNDCKLCPKGTYSDTTDATSCTQCPGNKTTADMGASSPEQCIATTPVPEEPDEPDTPKTYTVTYSCGSGATGSAPSSASATYNANFTPAGNKSCTKTGYTFAGWNDGSADWTAGTAKKWTYNSDKTFTAKWIATTYNITYELNDGVFPMMVQPINSYTFGIGATIDVTPKKPQSIDHFIGWCTDSGLTSCAKTQIISTTDTGDKTFYAKWGGITIACPAGSYINDSGDCVQCPAGTYSTETNSTECIQCSGTTTANQTACFASVVCDKKQTVCPDGYDWSDEACDCVASMVCDKMQQKCLDGYDWSDEACACVESGLPTLECFAGAYLNNGICTKCPAGSYSLFGATECTECPVNTYAAGEGNWRCQPCPDGTTTSNLTGQTECGECVIRKCNTSAGLIWSDEACACISSCTAGTYLNKLICAPCPTGTTSPDGATSVVQCVPDETTYTITYDNNGGTGCSSQQGIYGTELTCTPSKTGYRFDGWYTAANEGTEVTNITSTTTVYAHWTENTITCSAGTYLPANSSSCVTCLVDSYCAGGEFTQSSSVQGLKACPSGSTSLVGANQISQCTCQTGYQLASVQNQNLLQQLKTNPMNFSVSGNPSYKSLIGTSGACNGPNVNTLNNGEFEIPLNGSFVYGQALCSGTGQNPFVLGTPVETNNGLFCWCKITGYKQNSGSLRQLLSSKWMVAHDGTSLGQNCQAQCAKSCTETITNTSYSQGRINLFGSIDIDYSALCTQN